MSSTALPTTIDPLRAFVAGAFVARTPHPLPLIATAFDVILDAGLAIVTTTRRFRNAEQASIEATITFPVPVHATLFDLTARIGERVLRARARRRSDARAAYEGAVDAGKTAVLHEEVLRGVHMLSVAHVPPGTEVEVRATWALTLTNIDGRGCLRIPLTVGDIYGRSGLPDADDLAHGGRPDRAQLTVACRDGVVTLRGAELSEGQASVSLDAPIDLVVAAWTPRDLCGTAADGRAVTLRVAPAPSADRALDVAILIDRSGSMAESCSGAERGDSKHHAVLRGLRAIARQITTADTIDLWEFDNMLDHVGSTDEPYASPRGGEATESELLLALIQKLGAPNGGTEIGHALAGVIDQSRARDLLLITDGKSHALDVQELARSGRRIGVVLVGEDSLEANVGHLSALTGGEIFVASGSDLATVLMEALRSLRVPGAAPEPMSGRADHLATRRGGMTITAAWQDSAAAGAPETIERRGVAAVAASLLLSSLSTEAAAAIAEAEGLVTHLTSLVLVDEAGAVQQTVPAARKIPLPSPRTFMAAACAPPPSAPRTERPVGSAAHSPRMVEESGRRSLQASTGRASGKMSSWFRLRRPDIAPVTPAAEDVDLSRVARLIDWDLVPQKLQSGDLSMLVASAAAAIRAAATNKDVVALARTLGLDPVVLIIGLLAHAARAHRTAARVARAVFGGEPPAQTRAIVRQLHIEHSAA